MTRKCRLLALNVTSFHLKKAERVKIGLRVKKEKMGMDRNDIPKRDYKSHITSHITKNLENSSFLENSRRFSTPSQMKLLLTVFVDLFRHPFLNITF